MKFSGNFFGEIYCQWQGLDRGLINKEYLGEIARIFHWYRQGIPFVLSLTGNLNFPTIFNSSSKKNNNHFVSFVEDLWKKH